MRRGGARCYLQVICTAADELRAGCAVEPQQPLSTNRIDGRRGKNKKKYKKKYLNLGTKCAGRNLNADIRPPNTAASSKRRGADQELHESRQLEEFSRNCCTI